MSSRLLRAALSGLTIAFLPLPLFAHEIVGNRFFPATLGIDDPGVNDELSLPTVDAFKTGDVRRYDSVISPATSPSALPRISPSRLARPTPGSAHLAGPTATARAAFKTRTPA